jgi:hypothetical protein
MFKPMADVDMTLVPHLGLGSTPAVAHLLAGKIDAMFDPMPSSIAPIRAERLIPLAVTTPAKSDALPSPVGIRSGCRVPGGVVVRYRCAPSNARCFGRETQCSRQRSVQGSGNESETGGTSRIVAAGSVTQFHAFIQSETVRYAEVIRSADISAK